MNILILLEPGSTHHTFLLGYLLAGSPWPQSGTKTFHYQILIHSPAASLCGSVLPACPQTGWGSPATSPLFFPSACTQHWLCPPHPVLVHVPLCSEYTPSASFQATRSSGTRVCLHSPGSAFAPTIRNSLAHSQCSISMWWHSAPALWTSELWVPVL